VTAFLGLQLDDDWTGYLWFIVFIVIPLLARFFKWLGTKLGLLREGDAAQAELERGERLERARAERKQAESEGEELWRRLARGELAEPPATPAPVPVPPPRVPEAFSLETEEEPQPLSVLGQVTELSEAPEVSLETETEPVPLEALSQLAAAPPTPAAEAVPSLALLSVRGDLRRAIVLSEVLGPPLSERSLRA
jgi:hypothetical protein